MVPAMKARISVALNEKNKKIYSAKSQQADFDYAISMVEVEEVLEIACGALQAKRLKELATDELQPDQFIKEFEMETSVHRILDKDY
jgi:hypothetical protein